MIRLWRYLFVVQYDFRDSAQASRARVLLPLSSAMALLSLLFAGLIAVEKLAGMSQDATVQIMGDATPVLILWTGSALRLIQRGHLRRGAALIALLLWGFAALSLGTDGITPRAMMMLPVVLVYMGLAYGSRGTLLAIALITLALPLTAYGQSQGMLAAAAAPLDDLLREALLGGLMLALAGLLLWAFAWNLQRALLHANRLAGQNAELLRVADQRAEEMAFLFQVTTAAATSPDLEAMLRQVVETLRTTLDISHASIFLPDENSHGSASGDLLVTGADVSRSGSSSDISGEASERGLVGWVVRHGQPVVIQDTRHDPRRVPHAADSRSAIAVPLRTAGGLVGVLTVESERPNAFDEHKMRLLQTLSGSLAAIIQNSRLLREVQQANEQLLEMDRLKTNFLAAMSHELRTPLNSIIGFSRIILKGIDGPLTAVQEEDLTTIHNSGKHLLGLVNDILDEAKIEAGKMELSCGCFKLPDVIHGVMSTAVGLTRDKGLQLFTQIAEDLPDAYGDEFRTRQVLLNLVSNASKFTDQGSITVAAYPIHEQGADFICVAVTDTGIGIAPEDMHLLFEAFQQVDNSTTRAHEGTGMGLPLAKSFTELQGGRIWVESEPGRGSTFRITLPVAPRAESVVALPAQADPVPEDSAA